MGLRQRTAVSMIRMQRQKAEASGPRTPGKIPLRSARSVSFSHIDSTKPLHRQDQEDSARLLQRLRQALHPLTEEQFQASKEYESLQDELLRLTQLKAQEKTQTKAETWEDVAIPYAFTLEQSPDSQPYRTIKIVTQAPQPVERLELTPLDLSRYREAVQESPAPVRNLTLVTPETTPVPEAPELLMGEEVQLGHATADLTQQSLAHGGPGQKRITISPKVALSLLDS